MSRKARRQALEAELDEVRGLLRLSVDSGDPLGELQFGPLVNRLTGELAAEEATVDGLAQISLYFGGGPVFGSKGISAMFAGTAIRQFQGLVSETVAAWTDEGLGARGPVANAERSELAVTEVARGSFGFVLEELSEQASLLDTPLSQAVSSVADLVSDVSAEGLERFEAVLASADRRVLRTLGEFFENLFEERATMKIVEGDREFSLGLDDVRRAYERIGSSQLEEEEREFVGKLVGLLPGHRKFELRLAAQEILYGTVSKDLAQSYEAGLVDRPLIGETVSARVRVRELVDVSGEARRQYHLLDLVLRPSES